MLLLQIGWGVTLPWLTYVEEALDVRTSTDIEMLQTFTSEMKIVFAKYSLDGGWLGMEEMSTQVIQARLFDGVNTPMDIVDRCERNKSQQGNGTGGGEAGGTAAMRRETRKSVASARDSRTVRKQGWTTSVQSCQRLSVRRIVMTSPGAPDPCRVKFRLSSAVPDRSALALN